jgi:hypothetical protein
MGFSGVAIFRPDSKRFSRRTRRFTMSIMAKNASVTSDDRGLFLRQIVDLPPVGADL